MISSVENAGFPAAVAARGASGAAPLPEPGEAPPPADAVGEAEAWADVLAAWQDEARHRAYLARFADLEGLALAGRRYRDVLLARPRDAIAARQRDEVVRRAVAVGLAALPRTAPAAGRSRTAVRVASLALLAALAAAAVLALRALAPYPGAAP